MVRVETSLFLTQHYLMLMDLLIMIYPKTLGSQILSFMLTLKLQINHAFTKCGCVNAGLPLLKVAFVLERTPMKP